MRTIVWKKISRHVIKATYHYKICNENPVLVRLQKNWRAGTELKQPFLTALCVFCKKRENTKKIKSVELINQVVVNHFNNEASYCLLVLVVRYLDLIQFHHLVLERKNKNIHFSGHHRAHRKVKRQHQQVNIMFNMSAYTCLVQHNLIALTFFPELPGLIVTVLLCWVSFL